jgi:hypothetical protein
MELISRVLIWLLITGIVNYLIKRKLKLKFWGAISDAPNIKPWVADLLLFIFIFLASFSCHFILLL